MVCSVVIVYIGGSCSPASVWAPFRWFVYSGGITGLTSSEFIHTLFTRGGMCTLEVWGSLYGGDANNGEVPDALVYEGTRIMAVNGLRVGTKPDEPSVCHYDEATGDSDDEVMT